jgi:hypothetical protein
MQQGSSLHIVLCDTCRAAPSPILLEQRQNMNIYVKDSQRQRVLKPSESFGSAQIGPDEQKCPCWSCCRHPAVAA